MSELLDPDADRKREVIRHLAYKGHGQINENVKARARQQFDGDDGTRSATHAHFPADQAEDDALRRQIEWHEPPRIP